MEEDEQDQEEFPTKHLDHPQATPIVYSAEDILSDIEMPPPLPLLSPNLEDLNPMTVVLSPQPPSSVEAAEDEIHTTTTTTTSPLLSSNSSLSSGWLDRDSLGDWTTCADVNGTSWQKWNCTAVGKESATTLWEEERRGGEDKLTATLDLTIIKDNGEEDAQSDSSSLGCSSEEGSSSDGREDMYDDREVSCGHSYIAEQVGVQGDPDEPHVAQLLSCLAEAALQQPRDQPAVEPMARVGLGGGRGAVLGDGVVVVVNGWQIGGVRSAILAISNLLDFQI